ncbi:unnamed protein product [Amoebophrya sp. A120]|nr:unnamed protein product [Amoebophrya sp. A120]|eukprot:GSA120T00008712001.1
MKKALVFSVAASAAAIQAPTHQWIGKEDGGNFLEVDAGAKKVGAGGKKEMKPAEDIRTAATTLFVKTPPICKKVRKDGNAPEKAYAPCGSNPCCRSQTIEWADETCVWGACLAQ